MSSYTRSLLAALAIVLLSCQSFRHVIRHSAHKSFMAKKNWDMPTSQKVSEKEADSPSGETYTVVLSKRAGISWGSDISFRWIYVLDIEPNGEAAQTGLIKKGDYIIGCGDVSTIGQDFDFVLKTVFGQVEPKFNYTFFRGTKEQLIGGPVPEPSDTTVSVTVQQEGKPDIVVACPGGTNLRRLLLGSGINPYRSLTRWTNCNGKQRCGTCIVEVLKGGDSCSRRALDEEATLRENPEGYRLSCVTSVYGDVTVAVQGPVGAAQWTR